MAVRRPLTPPPPHPLTMQHRDAASHVSTGSDRKFAVSSSYLWSSTRAPVFIDLRRGSQPLRNEHGRFFGAVQPEFRSAITRTQNFSKQE